MMTKGEARALIQSLIDDPQGRRWPPVTLDLLVGLTLDTLWSDILEAAPQLTRQVTALTPTSPGYIDLRETAHGGQLSRRFFRVQKVIRRDGENTQELGRADARDIVVANNEEIAAPEDTYAILGDQLWMFPLSVADTIELHYSYKPTAWRSLAENAYVPWPEGYEGAFAFEVAGRATLKGAAEDPMGFLALAQADMKRLLAAIERQSPGPNTIYFTDSPETWGSIF